MRKIKQIHLSAHDLFEKSKSDKNSQYLTIIPTVAKQIEVKYPEYVITLQERVNILETELRTLKEKLFNMDISQKVQITDKIAEDMIVNFLKTKKQEGKSKINIFDIAMTLCIPIDQIDKILDQLEKDGLISDIE